MTSSQNDFQFGKGGIGATGWEKLDGVKDDVSIDRGVTIKNIDDGGSVLLVNVEDTETPTAANSYHVYPGQSVFLPINRPDYVRVAGDGEGVDYTWYAN